MSSVSGPTSSPTPSNPSSSGSSNLSIPQVAGNQVIGDEGITIDQYMITTKKSEQGSQEILQEVERQQANIAIDVAKSIALEASSYGALISQLHRTYQSNQVDSAGLQAPTNGVNTAGTALNNQISNTGNQNAVAAYNQAVATFTAAQTTFNNSSKSQTDIDTYNAAIASFNSAAATYNSTMTGLGSINDKITSYNTQVDSYNAEIGTANAQITAENVNRAAHGQAPLPLKTTLPDASPMPTAATVPTYPPGATTLPTAVALPAPVTDNLVDYSGQTFAQALTASGLITAQEALKFFVKRSSNFQTYTTKDITKKPQKQLKSVTQPDAYITPQQSSSSGSSSAGGASSTASLNVAGADAGGNKIQAVLTHTLTSQLLANLNLPSSAGFEHSTKAMAAALFASTLHASYNPNTPNESLLVSALATLAGGVAQSKAGTTQATVTSYLENSEEFKNLNAADQKALSQTLTAALNTAVLTLGAAGLANQLGGATALAPALAPARIQGNPNLEPETFAQVQKTFDEAKETFGPENVAATAGKLTAEQLTGTGLNSQTAFNIGTAVGNSLVQNGFGSSQQGLIAQVQTAAQSANNGQPLSDQQASSVARSLLLLGLGTNFQLNAQSNLVQQQIEPESAANLVDQSTIRLFGFSPNYSQATISRRQDEPQEELSFSRELENQVSTFRAAGDQQSLDTVTAQLDNFNKTVDDVGSFLTNQYINPAHTFHGLMYGPRGTEFRRGQIDVNE